jgi:hypothetical protein
MEYQTPSIRSLIDDIIKGAIRIPAFQREFVWDYDHVAYLMDSIYKKYPFGSLLFWRTKNRLTRDRKLGFFGLPDAPDEYPVNYVLDGQQRLTSIFSVFQTELSPTEPDWPEIYFNIVADDDYQESRFSPHEDPDLDRHFPMSCLFDSVKYRQATDRFRENGDILRQLDELQSTFKEVTVPVQVLTTEERSSVAIVFERINRLGMELDTLQLLSAWTWNEDFDLLKAFSDLKDELEEFGFSGVGEDTNLILKCAAAILTGDVAPDKLIEMNGVDVRENFPRVRNGILGAIDFLKAQLNVANLKCLPYNALLVPIAVFFAEPDNRDVTYGEATLRAIKQWFWRSCFSRRYTSQTKRTSIRDIQEITKLKNGQSTNIDNVDIDLEAAFFLQNTFKVSSASTKTFILLLVNSGPKSFISGGAVDLEKVLQKYNRAEFHHVYPKAFLRDSGVEEERINALCNFAIINGADNRKISRKKPSEYAALVGDAESAVQEEILRAALCPAGTFNDDFNSFEVARSDLLVEFANKLMGHSKQDDTPDARGAGDH